MKINSEISGFCHHKKWIALLAKVGIVPGVAPVLVLVVVVGVGGAQGLHFRPSLSVILEIAGKKYVFRVSF